MTEQKKQKIAIVGAHCGRAAIEALVKAIDKDKLEVIMIDVDDVAKREEIIRGMGTPPPIQSIEMYKMPEYPETRAERRAKTRKKKRR
jgi:hypothetical protein